MISFIDSCSIAKINPILVRLGMVSDLANVTEVLSKQSPDSSSNEHVKALLTKWTIADDRLLRCYDTLQPAMHLRSVLLKYLSSSSGTHS